MSSPLASPRQHRVLQIRFTEPEAQVTSTGVEAGVLHGGRQGDATPAGRGVLPENRKLPVLQEGGHRRRCPFDHCGAAGEVIDRADLGHPTAVEDDDGIEEQGGVLHVVVGDDPGARRVVGDLVEQDAVEEVAVLDVEAQVGLVEQRDLRAEGPARSPGWPGSSVRGTVWRTGLSGPRRSGRPDPWRRVRPRWSTGRRQCP